MTQIDDLVDEIEYTAGEIFEFFDAIEDAIASRRKLIASELGNIRKFNDSRDSGFEYDYEKVVERLETIKDRMDTRYMDVRYAEQHF